MFKTRLVSGWRCVVEPPVNSCWDLPVLQQECGRTHLNTDHLSFVEDGRLFFLHLTQYLGKGILVHLHSKSHAKCPELYKQESVPVEVGEDAQSELSCLHDNQWRYFLLPLSEDVAVSCKLRSWPHSYQINPHSSPELASVFKISLLLTGKTDRRVPNTEITCT